MKAILEFPNSHHYEREYEKCDYFCPNCGHREVWIERGAGDYYVGEDYYCTHCDHNFNLPNCKLATGAYLEIIVQLRNNKTNKPTTPKGG